MQKTPYFLFLIWVILGSALVLADDLPGPTPSTNPTNKNITPGKDQSLEEQLADQEDCYNWTCEKLDWDPYRQYDELVAQGYVVFLDKREMERGLICLATQGAVAGTIAGEIAGSPENGAAIGAAIGAASGLIQLQYLIKPDDSQSQRVIRRFERDLRKWETKFSGCMSRKGYRVHSGH